MHVVSSMVPHFGDWLVEIEQSKEFTFLPNTKATTTLKGFFEKVGICKKSKSRSKASDPSLHPPPPNNHNNGLFASGPFELSWEAECESFKSTMDVFHQWNGSQQLDLLRGESRSSQDLLQRAMSVSMPISLSDGSGSNINRLSAKWRIAMVLLLLHDSQCRRPLMKAKGISAALYSDLADALSRFTEQKFDFAIGHGHTLKGAKLEYFDDPAGFVRRLQGLPDDDKSDDDPEDAPLAAYKQLREHHQCDILGIRNTFKNVTWIHLREKLNAEIDDELIDAWNSFEAVSPSSMSPLTILCLSHNHRPSSNTLLYHPSTLSSMLNAMLATLFQPHYLMKI